MTTHHDLDVFPIPKEKQPMFINEPWLVDLSLLNDEELSKNPEPQKDNIRVYVPLDLNADAIMRRLDQIIQQFSLASEKNEMNYSFAVGKLISQIEIYDQIWYARNVPSNGERKHSAEASALVERFIEALKNLEVLDSETFPYKGLEELQKEYLR